jgi:hypothetical protein
MCLVLMCYVIFQFLDIILLFMFPIAQICLEVNLEKNVQILVCARID